MAKGKVVRSVLDNPTVKKTLTKAKLGGAAVLAENAVDIVDNPVLNAAQGATLGFAVGGVPGAVIGGGLGYLIGDQYITFPMPMIAIPAHESHLLSGSPSMQVYIRAGETLVPTGGNVQDMNEGIAQAAVLEDSLSRPAKVKQSTPYQRAYSKNFQKVKGQYKTKAGKWKKNGFRNAVKAAHRMCK